MEKWFEAIFYLGYYKKNLTSNNCVLLIFKGFPFPLGLHSSANINRYIMAMKY